MGRGTLSEDRDGSGDPWGGLRRVGCSPGGLGQVGGHSLRTGTGLVTLGEVQDGWGTLREVQDGSVDPQGGPGRVRGHSRSSGTGRLTLGEDLDGSVNPWEGLGRVRGA